MENVAILEINGHGKTETTETNDLGNSNGIKPKVRHRSDVTTTTTAIGESGINNGLNRCIFRTVSIVGETIVVVISRIVVRTSNKIQRYLCYFCKRKCNS